MDRIERTAPVYVRVTEYKEVLDIIDVMKQKLKETNQALEHIKELKAEEDQEIMEWEQNVVEIAKRLALIDSAFFENE